MVQTRVHHTPPCPVLRRDTGEPGSQTWGAESSPAAPQVVLWQAQMLQHLCLSQDGDMQPLPRPAQLAACMSESPMSSFYLVEAPGLMEMEVPGSCCSLAGISQVSALQSQPISTSGNSALLH